MRTGIWLSITMLVAATLSMQSERAEAQRTGGRQAIVELGRRLFLDPAASRAGKFSCASCHEPEHGFSDPRRVSIDENGETRRHSQTLIDLKDDTGFHWDGEFDQIHQLLTARLAPIPEVMAQTRELLKSHFEAAERRGDRPSRRRYDKRIQELTPPYYGPDVPVSGTPLPRPQPILARLKDDGRYAEAFKHAFGSAEPTTERVIESMKAYLLSIKSGANRYDDYLAGDPTALNARERRGLRLFEGKAGCAQCHLSKPDADGFAKFTDYTFRNTGVAYRNLKLSFDKQPDIDAGLGSQTFADADIGSFKVPSLRDVARRAPYMHDGSLKSLEEVVDYYEKGGTTNGRIDPKVHAFDLDKKERADLVAFLHALTSRERPGIGKPTSARAAKLRVKLVGHDGKPMRALKVRATPFGDRLQGAPRTAEPIELTTDSQGNLQVPMPLWTHVKLSALGYEIGYDRPLPDTLKKQVTLLTVPRRAVYVEVIGHPRGKSLPSQLVGYAQGGRRGQNGDVKAITLRKVKSTPGLRRALYTAEKPKGVRRLIVTFDLGANTAATLREIDTSGGMADPLDFREG